MAGAILKKREAREKKIREETRKPGKKRGRAKKNREHRTRIPTFSRVCQRFSGLVTN
jgi:hypothetical protein